MKPSQIALCLTLLGITACSSIPVKRDYDTSTDFQRLKTYAWKSADESNDSLVGMRVRKAVNAVLAQKGFQPAKADGADFWVDYQHVVERETDSERVRTGIGLGGGSGGMFGSVGLGVGMGSQVREREVLAIDILDGTTGKVIWQGSAEKTLTDENPDRSAEKVNAAVKAILLKFPPKQKS